MTDRMTMPIAMAAVLMASASEAVAPSTGRAFTRDAQWHPSQAAYASLADVPSHNGGYRATLAFDRVGRHGAFTGEITLTSAAGWPVTGARLALEAGMPDHDSIATVRPRVITELGHGRYRVQNIRFDRSGWWNVRLQFSTATAGDSLAFNLVR